ncbi:sec13, partial [Drosophila busckii]
MVSLLQEIDTEHEDMVHHAALDFYGLLLATCSSDGSVRIFHSRKNNNKALAELKGHQGPVWQVAWAHPKFGNILASCSYDRKVIIWKSTSPRDWTKLYEYSNHDSSVNSVGFAPADYGLVLACASSDGSVSVLTCNTEYGVWDAKKIPNAHTIGVNAISWCPAQAPDAAFDQRTSIRNVAVKRLVSGGCDNLVKIWREDNDRWVEEQRLEAHSDWVRDVAWAPSIGLPRLQIATASQDRHVIIWSSNSDLSQWKPIILHTFDDAVWSISWSTTGNILAVTGGDNNVTLWKENSESQWIRINYESGTALQVKQLHHLHPQHQQQQPPHPTQSSDSEQSSNLSNSNLSNSQ